MKTRRQSARGRHTKRTVAARPSTESLPPAELGPVLDFMRLVWQVDHALQRRSKRMAARLGVTGRQRLVIRVVGRFPGIGAGHVARLLHLHPSTLTGVLERLTSRGLLRCRRDHRDGRRLLLTLTAKGRRFDTKTAGTVESAIAHTLAKAPPAKLQAAREVLESLAASLLANPLGSAYRSG